MLAQLAGGMVETVSTRSLGRTELCRCWRDRVGHEGSYQATQPPSKTLGLGSSAETTSTSATIFCLPPLRNGAIGQQESSYAPFEPAAGPASQSGAPWDCGSMLGYRG